MAASGVGRLTGKGHKELSDGSVPFVDEDVGYLDVCICQSVHSRLNRTPKT